MNKYIIILLLLLSLFSRVTGFCITQKPVTNNPDTEKLLSISIETVFQLIEKKQPIILIDIRNSTEFKTINIPGSVNIPLHFIKTKPYLKNKHLILINEGYSYHTLLEESRHLTSSGFHVSVLDGGLNLWKSKGGPILGDIFAAQKLNRVTPRMVYHEKENLNKQYIDISAQPDKKFAEQLPGTIHIPFSGNTEKFISLMNKYITENNRKPFTTVLIYNQDGSSYKTVEKIISNQISANIFYLQGGLKEYQSFLNGINLSQKTSEQKKSFRKCKTCGN